MSKEGEEEGGRAVRGTGVVTADAGKATVRMKKGGREVRGTGVVTVDAGKATVGMRRRVRTVPWAPQPPLEVRLSKPLVLSVFLFFPKMKHVHSSKAA